MLTAKVAVPGADAWGGAAAAPTPALPRVEGEAREEKCSPEVRRSFKRRRVRSSLVTAAAAAAVSTGAPPERGDAANVDGVAGSQDDGETLLLNLGR